MDENKISGSDKKLKWGLVILAAVILVLCGILLSRCSSNRDASGIPEGTAAVLNTDTQAENTSISETKQELQTSAEAEDAEEKTEEASKVESDAEESKDTDKEESEPEMEESAIESPAESEIKDETANDAGQNAGQKESNAEETKESTTQTTTTQVQTTHAPTTAEPTTQAPTTAAPTTLAPTTTAPTTQAPTTTAPTTQAPTAAPVMAESGTPFSNHGKLNVSGTHILDQNGNIYQLKGVSTHGIGWFPAYVNKASFQTMRDQWGINIVRLAMYTAEYNGYCSGGDQAALKNLVDQGVKAATELGMYVIIDWHILSDSNPNTNKAQAIAFFKEESQKYKDYGNVIYEICNEPNGGTSWSEIKRYAEEVIPVIRANAPDAIIIVGTPTWSQDVDQAAANPITGQKNIMYTLHYYAATHTDYLRNKLVGALSAGLPVFITEYGICDASGNGGIDVGQANAWMNLINQYQLGSCIWNLSNKSETSALINSSCSKTSGWTQDDLSQSGKWFVNTMMKGQATGNLPQQETQPQQTQPETQPQQTQPATQPQTEYVAPTTAAPQSASSANCKVDPKITNSWGDASQGYHAQIEVSITNTGSSAISGWKAVLTFSTNVSIDQSWNGAVTVNGNTVTITGDADWNKTLQAGSSASCGMILKGDSEISLKGCKIQ